MKRTHQPYMLSLTSMPHVIGGFEIEGHPLQILRLEEESTAPRESSLRALDARRELFRFEINRNTYVIVETTPSTGKPGRPPMNAAKPTIQLTQRELQIAALVAMGRPNKQIADVLHISEWTVSTHLRRMFSKLGVDTRAALVYRCAGLIRDT